MKWPPYLLKMQLEDRRHSFGLWLPLFLIWPVIMVLGLVVFLILLPFALLSVLFTWSTVCARPLFLGVPALLRLVCCLPGTRVDVGGANGRVYLALF